VVADVLRTVDYVAAVTDDVAVAVAKLLRVTLNKFNKGQQLGPRYRLRVTG